MFIIISSALASSTVAGKAFEPTTALGLPQAAPGSLDVVLTEAKVSCADLAEPGSERAKDAIGKASLVMAAFDPTELGAKPVLVQAVRGKYFAGGSGGGSLTQLDSDGGVLTLNTKLEVMGKGKPTRLKGDYAFKLCGEITARPSIAGTQFEEQAFKNERLPKELAVQVPVGWTPGQGPFGESWMAPDGVSMYSIENTSSMADLPASAKSQVESFQGDNRHGELLTSTAVDARTYLIRWRHRYADGPWSVYQTVHRFTEEGDWGVTCSIRGDERTADQAFEAFERACMKLDPK